MLFFRTTSRHSLKLILTYILICVFRKKKRKKRGSSLTSATCTTEKPIIAAASLQSSGVCGSLRTSTSPKMYSLSSPPPLSPLKLPSLPPFMSSSSSLSEAATMSTSCHPQHHHSRVRDLLPRPPLPSLVRVCLNHFCHANTSHTCNHFGSVPFCSVLFCFPLLCLQFN